MGETKKLHLTISFSGTVNNIKRGKGRVSKFDIALLEEILSLFEQTREEYLKGNKEIADQFFDYVV